jgi:hypothetical protein
MFCLLVRCGRMVRKFVNVQSFRVSNLQIRSLLNDSYYSPTCTKQCTVWQQGRRSAVFLEMCSIWQRCILTCSFVDVVSRVVTRNMETTTNTQQTCTTLTGQFNTINNNLYYFTSDGCTYALSLDDSSFQVLSLVTCHSHAVHLLSSLQVRLFC